MGGMPETGLDLVASDDRRPHRRDKFFGCALPIAKGVLLAAAGAGAADVKRAPQAAKGKASKIK
jgi:hypothetical protein